MLHAVLRLCFNLKNGFLKHSTYVVHTTMCRFQFFLSSLSFFKYVCIVHENGINTYATKVLKNTIFIVIHLAACFIVLEINKARVLSLHTCFIGSSRNELSLQTSFGYYKSLKKELNLSTSTFFSLQRYSVL